MRPPRTRSWPKGTTRTARERFPGREPSGGLVRPRGMYARLPILLGALALALFGVALAVASPFDSSHDRGNANDTPVRLERVDVVVAGGFAYRRREAHVTDAPRLKQLAQTLPVPLPSSRRLPTTCADCYETTVPVRTTGGAVRTYRWNEVPPRGLAPFPKALAGLI